MAFVPAEENITNTQEWHAAVVPLLCVSVLFILRKNSIGIHDITRLLFQAPPTFRAIVVGLPSDNVRTTTLRAPYACNTFYLAMFKCTVEDILTILAQKEM